MGMMVTLRFHWIFFTLLIYSQMKQMIEFRLKVLDTRFRYFFISLQKAVADTTAFSLVSNFWFFSLRIIVHPLSPPSSILVEVSWLYIYADIQSESCTIEIKWSILCFDWVPIFSKLNSCFPLLNIRSISHRLRYWVTTSEFFSLERTRIGFFIHFFNSILRYTKLTK